METDEHRWDVGPKSALSRSQVGGKSESLTEYSFSSSEAELVAMTEVGNQAIFFTSLIQELMPGPLYAVIHCVNQGANATMAQDSRSRKLRHMDIRYNFLKDLIDRKFISIKYICTEEMVADILTKALPGPRHKELCQKLGLNAL